MHECGGHGGQQRAPDLSRAGVTEGCELPHVEAQKETQEKYVLLTTEPSLQFSWFILV